MKRGILFLIVMFVASLSYGQAWEKIVGITATRVEVNKLHGMTASTAEMNRLVGLTQNVETALSGKVDKSTLVDPYLFIYRKGQVDTLLTTNLSNVAINSTFPATGNIFVNSTNNKQYYFSNNYWRSTAMNDSAIATTGYLAGLVAAYEFDETSGTTVKNWVKSAPNGTLYGNTAINQTGKLGKCVYFDGTGDYIDCTNSTAWNFTNSFTWMAWVKAETPVTSNAYIFAKVTAVDVRSYSVWTSTNVNNYFFKSDNSDYLGTGTVSPSLATWAHIAIVFNGSTIKLYHNGVEKSSTATTGVFPTTTVSMLIGGLSTTASFYKGWIDQMCFFNTAKSVNDILYYYNSGTGRTIATWAR